MHVAHLSRPDHAGYGFGIIRSRYVQFQQQPTTTPDQTPDIALEAQERAEKNLEEVSGGAASPKLTGNAEIERDVPMRTGGHGGNGSYW